MASNTKSGTKISVTKPQKAIESTWKSMKSFYEAYAKSNKAIWVTKEDYFENGAQAVVTTFGMGNRYN